MPLKELFHLPQSKYRVWAVLGSLGFGAIGLFFGFSITAAFLGFESAFSIPGFLFIHSYGVLAYCIPAYLLYAAFLLADPAYKPERIFLLCGSALPFFTLALGFYWIREMDNFREESSFVVRAGKFGTGFFFLFLSALEVLVLLFIRYLLFIRKENHVTKKDKSGHKRERNDKPGGGSPMPKPGSGSLRDIYAKAAAAMAAEGDYDPVLSPAALAEQTASEDSEPHSNTSPGGNSDMVGRAYIKQAKSPAADETSENQPASPQVKGEEDESDEDVEKALAEAAALAEEEAARHGDKKSSGDSAGKKATRERKRHLPYFVPVEGILKQYPDGEYWIIDEETRNAAHTLKETFKEFNIQVEVTGIRKGPVITMFEILPAPGIRLTKIENLADNIALRLAAQSVRIVAPIPGKHAVGVEVPNARRNIVSFREIIEGELSRDGKKNEVPVVLGKDITGEAVTVDLVQMPHLLIAGATGSGKSVCVNSMILTILYQKTPAECRLILIDPKIVELKLYNDIPHLLTPVITEPKKAFQALQYCIYEMERRYACLDSMGVRDIRSYNRRIKERDIAAEHLPYIVVVIDEFADLMATTGKELESTVARLAAMSRAVGIHLVLATQRPSIDVITGLIKANIPSRIAFMVASKMDSRIIIDMVGAEKLLGKGDMLYAGVVDPFPIRMQGAFISEEEVERVVDYVKSLGEPDYIDDEIFYDEEEDSDPSLFSDGDDPLYEKALEIVMQQGKASASFIQRRLKIGYNRAARLVEEMEHHGVVGPAQGSKPRELLRGINI